MRALICLVLSTPFLGRLIFAETSDDEAIRKTALDYIEGWYTGDAIRMERALHPELAKRMISTDPKTAAANSITWAR